MNILVVDDSSVIRIGAQKILGSNGYGVVLAEDGLDAIDKLRENEIDLIICDVNMPRMDGLTFLKELKQSEELIKFKYIPVLMLTTESSEKMKSKGEEYGAKAWMVKPFQPAMLLNVISKLIGVPQL